MTGEQQGGPGAAAGVTTGVAEHGVGDERPVTVAEARGWLEASERSLRLARSFRRRYLAADPDERRNLLRTERPGSGSLTDINTTIAQGKANVERFARLVASLEEQAEQ